MCHLAGLAYGRRDAEMTVITMEGIMPHHGIADGCRFFPTWYAIRMLSSALFSNRDVLRCRSIIPSLSESWSVAFRISFATVF